MPAVAAGSQEQHAALAAGPRQRASPAPPAGVDPREELLCLLELCGWALLEQHQTLGSANGWVHTAVGMGGVQAGRGRNTWVASRLDQPLGVNRSMGSLHGGR